MALLMLEGWDTYPPSVTWADANTLVALQRNWDTRTSTQTGYSITSAGRGGGNCGNFNSDAANFDRLERNFGSAHPTTVLVFSWMPTGTTGNVNAAIVTLLDSAAVEMGRLYLNGSGGQLVYRNGSSTTILTTSFAGGFQTNSWYTIELKVTAGTSTGAVEIRANAVSVGSATSVNTVGAANTSGMQWLCLGARSATANFCNWTVDHLVVMDSVGTALNDFLGDRRIYTIVPNGAGTYSQWTPSGATPNYNCVAENGIDQDTTYNGTATVNAIDSYALSDLAVGSMPVYAIQVSAHVRKDDVSTRQAQLLLRTNGTDQLVGSVTNLATDYSTRLVAIATTNPATSAAWTGGEINALEAGIKLIA